MVGATMRSAEEQFAGLRRLAEVIGKHECNVAIKLADGDVASLTAVDTPGASEVVYVVGGYDVWTYEGGRQRLQAGDLSCEQAAEIVVSEYFLAKAARIKQHSPHLDADQIMAKLREGYQRKANK